MDTITINDKVYNRSRHLVNLHRAEPISKTAADGIQQAFASFGERSKANFGEVDFKNPDLTYLQGIFVTSGQNYNRDVFLPSEMLHSFVTARMKPINIEHTVEENGSLVKAFSKKTSIPLTTGKNTIIGSIYDVAFVHNKSGKMLLASDYSSENAKELFDLDTIDDDFTNPDNRYHIIIAAALWKFMFPETIADIVEEIDQGGLALSMESFFLDYDLLANNEVKARRDNPELDSLYKQRMSVGGQKVGRVLRNILWGGGGLVDTPGNPYGFEFISTSASEREKGDAVLTAAASLVSVEKDQSVTVQRGGDGNSNTENQPQGDNSRMDLEKTLAKFVETNESLVQANANLNASKATLETEKASLSAAKAALETKVAELETAKAALEANLSKKTAEHEALASTHAKLNTEFETIKATLTEKEKALTEAEAKVATVEELTQRAAAAEAKINEYNSAAVVASRKKELEELNLLIDDDTNEALARLDDDEFKAVVAGRKKVAAAASAKTESSEPGRAKASVPFLGAEIKDKASAMSAVAAAGSAPATGNLTFDQLVSIMTKV